MIELAACSSVPAGSAGRGWFLPVRRWTSALACLMRSYPPDHASLGVSTEDWEDGMAHMSKICRDYAFVFALVAGLPAVAWADAASEVVTAQMHADLAVHATDLSGVQMHLHHALNCLVGPGGAGFDPKQMNPCANAGKGAIPDATDPAKKKLLNDVAEKVRSGIASTEVSSAQKVAVESAAIYYHAWPAARGNA